MGSAGEAAARVQDEAYEGGCVYRPVCVHVGTRVCVYTCMCLAGPSCISREKLSSPREAVDSAGLQRGSLTKSGLVCGCWQSWVGGWTGPEGWE